MSVEEDTLQIIMDCISSGHNEQAIAIIEGIDHRSELADTRGLELMYYSLFSDNIQMVEYFINEGCNLNVQRYGCTLLTLAVRLHKIRVVRLLLEKNVDIYQINRAGGKNCFEEAFYRRLHPIASRNVQLIIANQNIILKLLFDKVNDDFLNDRLTHLLMVASNSLKLAMVVYGSANLTRFLLKNGFPIDFREPVENYTPLHCAIALGRFEAAKVLIEHGANIDALDANHCTPLNYYICHFEDEDRNSEVLKIFLKRSNMLFVPNKSHEYTLMQNLLMRGKMPTVKTIMPSFANLDERIAGSRTLASLIIENRNVDFLEIVSETSCGIDVHKRSASGFSSLMSAALTGCPKNVEWLLQQGVDVNVTSLAGFSALSYAMSVTDYSKLNSNKEGEIVQVIELLCQYGADVQYALESRPEFMSNLSGRSKVLIAHLALLEVTKQSVITETTRIAINQTVVMKSYFELCKYQLKKMKDLRVFSTVNLFTLLAECNEKFFEYAANELFLQAWTVVMEHSTNYISYYSNLLRRRFSKGLDFSRCYQE